MTAPDAWWSDLRVVDLVFNPPEDLARDALGALSSRPIVLLPEVEEPRQLPNGSFEWKHWTEAQTAVLRGLDWLVTQGPDVINLSLGYYGTFDPQDPLQLLTLRAWELGIVVVAAAGNRGPRPATLTEFAQAPWVISVGATDEHLQILETSSRGAANGPHPTVVSCGMDAIDPPMAPGTSFAAPRVAGAAGLLIGALRLLDARWRRGAPADEIHPMRLGFADTGIDPDRLERHFGVIAQSIRAQGGAWAVVPADPREVVWMDEVSRFLDARALEVHTAVEPSMVARAICLATRPLPADEAHVGNGYFSMDEAMSLLGSLTPSRLLAIYGLLLGDEHRSALDALDERLGPLWNHVHVFLLHDLVVTPATFDVARVVD